MTRFAPHCAAEPDPVPTDIPALRRYPWRTESFARRKVTQLVYEAFPESEIISLTE